MDEHQARETVIQVIARGRGVDPRTLSAQTSLVEDLGFDSLDAAELLAALHSQTGAHLPVSDLSELQTIEDVTLALTKLEVTS